MKHKKLLAVACAMMIGAWPAVSSLGAATNPDGQWKQENGLWYYYGTDGTMKTGWQQIGGIYYYLYEDGHCAINEVTPDGFRVDGSGAWYEVKKEILGQEITIPSRFIPSAAMSENWGNQNTFLEGLNQSLDKGFAGARKLSVTPESVEYISVKDGKRYLGLYKDSDAGGYRLDIRIKLDRSSTDMELASTYNYGVFQALLSVISSSPDQLCDAIYSSWQEQNRYGLTRGTYTQVGDCQVMYESGQGYGKFFIRPLS